MYWEKIRRQVVTFGTILGTVLLYGGVQLAFNPVNSETVRIGSITSSEAHEYYRKVRESENFTNLRELADRIPEQARIVADSVYSLYFTTNLEAVDAGAEIVIWPEGSNSVLKEYEPEFLRMCRSVAREYNIYLLMGYYVYPNNWPKNYGAQKMTLIDKQGQVQWEYLKSNIIPGNTNVKGDGIVSVLDTEYGRLGGVIRYDMDFPHHNLPETVKSLRSSHTGKFPEKRYHFDD